MKSGQPPGLANDRGDAESQWHWGCCTGVADPSRPCHVISLGDAKSLVLSTNPAELAITDGGD